MRELYDALEQAARTDSPDDQLRQLKKLQRTFSAQLKSDEDARELYLRDLAWVYQDLEDWKLAHRTLRQRLEIVRPATRSTHAFAILVAEYLAVCRRAVKPTPYVCEVLDQIRFVEDIAVEPAAVVALRQMVQLPDFKLCGKAIYIFKKVARRYGKPELPFTKPSVDQLNTIYMRRYAVVR